MCNLPPYPCWYRSVHIFRNTLYTEISRRIYRVKFLWYAGTREYCSRLPGWFVRDFLPCSGKYSFHSLFSESGLVTLCHRFVLRPATWIQLIDTCSHNALLSDISWHIPFNFKSGANENYSYFLNVFLISAIIKHCISLTKTS